MVFNNSPDFGRSIICPYLFDVRHTDDTIESPFVMLIDDPKSDALNNLVKLYKRVDYRSENISVDDLN